MNLYSNDSPRLKVALNAWFLSQPDVGMGQYVRWLTPALLAADPKLDLYLISPRPFSLETISPHINQIVAPTPFSNNSSYQARLWFEQITFPRACRRLGVDLAHVPYYGLSLLPGVASVVTVHDLIPLIVPVYRQNLWLRLYSRSIKIATPRAKIILTVSQASRQDILRHLAVDPTRVRAIYSAPAPNFNSLTEIETLAALKIKYNLPNKYILYVGGYDARKNIALLLEAYAGIPRDIRGQFPLVLAGKLPVAHSPMWPDPRLQINSLGLENDLIIPGWIPQADLPAIYNAATLFVYPSAYEGFGLPVLEAMASGTAVVTTNAASLPEIAGQAALLVKPDDVPGMTAAISTLITDKEQNQRAVRLGLAHAKGFSWEQTASQTLQAYRDAL